MFKLFSRVHKLIDLIIKTDRARIINVSSDAHYMCKHLDENDLNFEKNPSAGKFLTIYAASKLCNILFTKELARKLESLGTCYFMTIFKNDRKGICSSAACSTKWTSN